MARTKKQQQQQQQQPATLSVGALVDAAHAAQDYAQGASETLYRAARKEPAYPDPGATAKGLIALAQHVNALAAVVYALVRLAEEQQASAPQNAQQKAAENG